MREEKMLSLLAIDNSHALPPKEPLFSIIKRDLRPKNQVGFLKLLSVLIALIVGGLFILVIGENPVKVYTAIISGALRSSMAFESTLRIMIPLLISSLGISIAFKMRFWNIGAEGQIVMGAIFSTYFALYFSHWNHTVLMISMFLASLVGGALWGLIPAFFKAKYNTNETLLTLMLNYIALSVVTWLRDGLWADPSSPGFPKIARFTKNAQLGKLLGVQKGWVIALMLVVLVSIYLKYTKQGYELAVAGESVATARYAGMKVFKIILRTMTISGGICGLVGFVQSAGSDMTLAHSVAGGVGFTAIIVAWLAGLHPVGILIVSFLFSVLEKGSSVMQSSLGLSSYVSQVLQGIILFCVLAGEFFVTYQIVTSWGKGEGSYE